MELPAGAEDGVDGGLGGYDGAGSGVAGHGPRETEHALKPTTLRSDDMKASTSARVGHTVVPGLFYSSSVWHTAVDTSLDQLLSRQAPLQTLALAHTLGALDGCHREWLVDALAAALLRRLGTGEDQAVLQLLHYFYFTAPLPRAPYAISPAALTTLLEQEMSYPLRSLLVAQAFRLVPSETYLFPPIPTTKLVAPKPTQAAINLLAVLHEFNTTPVPALDALDTYAVAYDHLKALRFPVDGVPVPILERAKLSTQRALDALKEPSAQEPETERATDLFRLVDAGTARFTNAFTPSPKFDRA